MSPNGRHLRALLYGDVDLDRIDGSAIWLQSTAEILARAGADVTVLLKTRPRTPEVVDAIAFLPNVRLIGRTGRELGREGRSTLLSPAAAGRVMRRLDAAEPFDLIVVRGTAVAASLAAEAAFAGRLWSYLTDIPQSVAGLAATDVARLGTVARASQVLLCQTEDLRSFIETALPDAAGRTAILPPVIPDLGPAVTREPPAGRPLRLVYSGKFAPTWNTLAMTTLPDRLADLGVPAELHVIGDKIHADPDDPTYAERMRAALETSRGVIWHGRRSRAEAIRLSAAADIGLGWRDRSLDASLELSTKVLEYGSVGLAVVLNRTPMHERLLGRDYPLFVSSEEDVAIAIAESATDPEQLAEAARRCLTAARRHTVAMATERIRTLFGVAFPPPLRRASADRPLRIGVASHNLKFFSRIHEHFQRLPGVEVRFDHWPSLGIQDGRSSRRLLGWADVVICEWCGPNAVWYSERVRPEQRLIVRLHRFELDREWPGQVAIDRVDRVVCVSDLYAKLTGRITGWPSSKIQVIPNWVDIAALDRPKLAGAETQLGFIGMAPALKRLDRALDVLEILRGGDRRFRLSVKSKLPWEYPWVWREAAERAHADEVMRRVQTAELLRGAVAFDPFGPDVGSWLRRVGFVLSTSDHESFHLAPAEGMASGAVPMLLDWPGAEAIYDQRWIHRSEASMASAIASIVEEGRWEAEAALARSQVSAYGLDAVAAAWDALLESVIAGDVPTPGIAGSHPS